MLFTADSLGDPKGVLRTDKNTIAAVDHAIGALDMTDKTKVLVAVPLFHAYGWDLGFLPTLKLGCTMFLEEEISRAPHRQADPRARGRRPARHAVDVRRAVEAADREEARAQGAEVPRRRLAPRSDRSPTSFLNEYGIRILSCYHSTEAATVALEDTGKYPTTVGKPIDGVEVKITAPDGKPQPATKEGLIWVKSKTLSPKSIGPFDEENAAPTSRASRHGRRSARSTRPAGCAPATSASSTRAAALQITGREDDVVKVDGKRVALGEVEGCLEAFPKIKAAQATVVTDPMAGSMVVARVVMKQKCAAEEIIDHCARNLAPYKVPSRIEFCEAI